MTYLSLWQTDCDARIVSSDGKIPVMTEQQTSYKGIKLCPRPTSLFVRRELPEQRAIAYLLDDSTYRKVFVIHGLGGAGKTQMALQIIQWTHEHWSDIVYADATSVETIETTLSGFSVLKGIGDTYRSTLHWLESNQGRWLLVLDNADDLRVDILKYIPNSSRGSILITTRSQELVQLAEGAGLGCNISGMESDESLRLLVKASHLENETTTHEDMDAAKALLEVCNGALLKLSDIHMFHRN